MKPVRQLVRIRHGSHLYGTSTPQSDQDFKGVHLPSGEAIVLGRPENHINRNVVSKAEGTDKNTADAIDDESFSVAKFFEMLMKGDTVATEILFAPVDYPSAEWLNVRNIGKQLLNRQCKGFVGYCVRQAAKYGIKGSRMGAVRGVLDFLAIAKLGLTRTAKMSAIEAKLHDWSAGREHVMWEDIPHPGGKSCWHLNVCDRKVPMTISIEEAEKIWTKVWENYGERARKAKDNDGIDWKAVSHAVRVAGQAIELLETGHITFPRPDAAYLLGIKQGMYPYSDVSAELEELVAAVGRASEDSILPEKSDHKLADRTVLALYMEQIR
jgi:hypothetical protein